MMRPGDQIDDKNLQAPRRLADDLRGEYGRHIDVPAQVDETVLRMAQLRFARRRRPIMVLRWAGVSAVAAVLLLAVGSLVHHWMALRSPATSAPFVMAAREDVDGNGRVDILDAFVLARHIEASRKPRDDWDVTGDGIVNQADVDRIAMAAVSLERGRLQ